MLTDPDMIMASEPRRVTLLRCLCLLLATAVVFQLFYLGSQPLAAGLIPAPWDKLAHLAVYSAITVLLWTGTGGSMPAMVVAMVIVIGALDELHQAGVPGRRAEMGDFLVDVCAGVGTSVALLLYARIKQRLL